MLSAYGSGQIQNEALAYPKFFLLAVASICHADSSVTLIGGGYAHIVLHLAQPRRRFSSDPTRLQTYIAGEQSKLASSFFDAKARSFTSLQ